MKILLFTTGLLFCTLAGYAQDNEAAIRGVLARQQVAWNAGNIESYMHGYWQNDSLIFIGKNGPTYGYAATLERYRTSYPDTAHMGSLTLAVISMKALSPEYYFVIGTWALKRGAGDLSGSWTLLFRKISGEWVIVVDHSS